MNSTKIRVASLSDADAILKIYAPYVEKTSISFEYTSPGIEEFKERMANIQRQYPYLVLENAEGEICGYAYASRFRIRASYDWSAETSIYIKQNHHGLGYGRALYTQLEAYLKEQHILNAYACITHSAHIPHFSQNSSFLFHQKMGYVQAGVFRNCGYKFSKWHHIIWMEKTLGKHTAHTPPFIPFPELHA